MTRWIRNRPEPRHEILSGLVAVAAGATLGVAVYYLTRLYLAREPLPASPARAEDDWDRQVASGRQDTR